MTRVEEFSRSKRAIYLYEQEQAAASAVQRASSNLRAAELAGNEERLHSARAQYADALRPLAGVLDDMIEHGMRPPGKPRGWVETIRSLSLSRHPDSLQVYEREAVDDGER